MDIGVIGYWFATNYGGVSSYYSLYSALEKMGHTPFLVETPYLAVDKEGVDVFSRNFFKSINARITKSYTNDQLGELNDLADTFVLGSDQVVTISSIRAFGKLFLMEFLGDNKKRIAVSASCGGDNLSNPETLSYAGPLLKKFTAFSVREKSAQSILKEKLSVDSDLVIDPIFLTSSEQFKKLSEMAKLNSPEQPYMAAYVLDPTDDKKTCIYNLSAKLGLAAKVILDGRKFTHEKNAEKMGMPDCTLPELDMPQWLHYLSNASFIFTDSFHGAAMAIILNKPFIMYANYLRGYPRFVTLAETFNVKDRLIDNSSQLTDGIVNKKIDFDAINKTIEAERTRLIKWLEHALEMPAKKIDSENIGQNNISETSSEPYYSIESYKKKSSEPYSVLSKDKCTGCSACASICPVKCITMKADNEGFKYPSINENECKHCGMCTKVCPVINKSSLTASNPLNTYAGYSLDNDVRYMSTSGGAFTEFAKYALKMSGVCYGAAYNDDFSVSHVRISSEDELPIIRQSKYLQSDINDTYQSVKRDLDKGLYVMFCGTPCQCAGLRSYLKTDYNRLIVCDFICHSICSPKAFAYYLKDVENKNNGKASRVWFKNKETTWKNFSLRIDFQNKSEYYRKTCTQDAYFESFLKYKVCSRPSCHACSFKGTDRYSDVTLADFWGLKWKNPQFGEEQMKNGVSLIILNSQKGKFIFDNYVKYNMYTEEHQLEEAIKGNGGYHNSQRPGLYRDYFWNSIEKMPFSEIIDLIRNRENKIHNK